MVADMFSVIIDSNITDNTKSINNFRLIYCEPHSVFSPNPINLRRDFKEGLYPFEILNPFNNFN